jgi:hypothetical protein
MVDLGLMGVVPKDMYMTHQLMQNLRFDARMEWIVGTRTARLGVKLHLGCASADEQSQKKVELRLHPHSRLIVKSLALNVVYSYGRQTHLCRWP